MRAVGQHNDEIDFLGKLPDELWSIVFTLAYPLAHKRAIEGIDFINEPYRFDSRFKQAIVELIDLANLRRLCKRLQPIVLTVLFHDIIIDLYETSLKALYGLLSSNNNMMKGAGVHTRRLALNFDGDGANFTEELVQIPVYFPNVSSTYIKGYITDDIGYVYPPPITKWAHNINNIVWNCEETKLSEILLLLRQNQNLETLWLPHNAQFLGTEDDTSPIPNLIQLPRLRWLQLPDAAYEHLTRQLSTSSIKLLSTRMLEMNRLEFGRFLRGSCQSLTVLAINWVSWRLSTKEKSEFWDTLGGCPHLDTLSVGSHYERLWLPSYTKRHPSLRTLRLSFSRPQVAVEAMKTLRFDVPEPHFPHFPTIELRVNGLAPKSTEDYRYPWNKRREIEQMWRVPGVELVLISRHV